MPKEMRSRQDYGQIRYEVGDPVAVITLDRPASLNAWTVQMDAELRDAVSRASQDQRVVGIIITGAGRAFCAGADMSDVGGIAESGSLTGDVDSASPRRVRPSDESDLSGRFSFLMALDKPVIAAVNGAVAGMGLGLALCCDMRVVTPDTVVLTAFAQRGLIAEWGIGWLLPRLVGPAVALDWLMSSRRVRGEEALRAGLANQLVPADELVEFCRSYISDIARTCSPNSIAVMKRQVYEQFHRGLGPAEREAYELMVASIAHPDFKEGVRSFFEKRPPDFARLGIAERPDSER